VVKDEVEESNLVFFCVFKETFSGSKHIFNFVELGKSAVLEVTNCRFCEFLYELIKLSK